MEKIKFSFDLSQCDFQIDSLQGKMLEFYLRADRRFRMAFNMNYTNEFLQFLKDKAILGEPFHLSVMGITRTFTDNHLIYTDLGMLKPSEIEKQKPKKVLSYNFDEEIYEWKNYELIKRKRNPKEKFYEIIFSDNRRLFLGENHPIFTENKGWKKSYSLYEGIKIPFFSNFLEQKFKNSISKEKARIYAFILSCGHLNGSQSKWFDKRDGRIYKKNRYIISYCKKEIEMVNQLRDDMKKEFNLDFKFKKKREGYNGIEIEKSDKSVFEELSKRISIGKKSDIIEIPKEIFNSSKEIQKEFVSVLFSGDGYVAEPKRQNIVEYYSCSRKFIEQLQMILLQYGVISCIRIKKRRKHNHNILYRLTITNKGNIINFKKFVGKLYSPIKEKRLNKMCNNFENIQSYLKPRKFYIKEKKSYDLEDEYIYDIHVEDNNNFFLNGILTHNSGKSSIASTIGFIHSQLYNREFNIDYICGNSIEFLEKIKKMSEKQTKNSYFQIDEEKSFFGVGSLAKKMKIQDVANIIAKHNISTSSLCPTGFSNKDSHYGLRIFGKDLKNMVCRMMLYNLQEGNSSRTGGLPMGNIYLPIPKAFLPHKVYEDFNTKYEAKKDRWIKREIMGEGDVLAKVKRDTAVKLNADRKFLQLRTKKDRITYITQVLGSEWSVGEISEIENLSKLLSEGVL